MGVHHAWGRSIKDIFLRYSPIFIPDMQTLSALWEGTCDYSVLLDLQEGD